MIDREQAIEYLKQHHDPERECGWIIDSILAIPDPVHDGAMKLLTALFAGDRDRHWFDVRELGAIERLRIALAMEAP